MGHASTQIGFISAIIGGVILKVEKKSSWALNQIVDLDRSSPGLAGSYLRASPERQHVIAAFLSSPASHKPDRSTMARLLMLGGHKAILQAAFGSVPAGYRSALARTVGGLQPQAYYRYLRWLLNRGDNRNGATALRHLTQLSYERLRVAAALPSNLRLPSIIGMHTDRAHARRSASLLRLLTEVGVSKDGLLAALRSAKNVRQFDATWLRWAERARLPAGPVPASESYQPVRTALEMKRLARRYRNCLRRYLTEAFEETVAFGLYRSEAGEAVVHLYRKDGEWLLDDLHGRENRPVAAQLRTDATSFLKGMGIAETVRLRRPRRTWDALREIASQCEWDDYGWA